METSPRLDFIGPFRTLKTATEATEGLSVVSLQSKALDVVTLIYDTWARGSSMWEINSDEVSALLGIGDMQELFLEMIGFNDIFHDSKIEASNLSSVDAEQLQMTFLVRRQAAIIVGDEFASSASHKVFCRYFFTNYEKELFQPVRITKIDMPIKSIPDLTMPPAQFTKAVLTLFGIDSENKNQPHFAICIEELKRIFQSYDGNIDIHYIAKRSANPSGKNLFPTTVREESKTVAEQLRNPPMKQNRPLALEQIHRKKLAGLKTRLVVLSIFALVFMILWQLYFRYL